MSEAAVAQVIHLTFHGVGEPKREIPPEEVGVWVTRGRFEEILDWAASKLDVRITFDDGNVSDVEVALPALRTRNMKAAFFILAGRLDQPGSVSRKDVATLREAGMTVGLHGMDHRPWRGLDDAALTVELVTARQRLEEAVGEPIRCVACPFGSYGRRALARLKAERFERVFTSDRGPAEDDAWLQARNTIHAADDVADVERIYQCRQRGLARELKLCLKRQWS